MASVKTPSAPRFQTVSNCFIATKAFGALPTTFGGEARRGPEAPDEVRPQEPVSEQEPGGSPEGSQGLLPSSSDLSGIYFSFPLSSAGVAREQGIIKVLWGGPRGDVEAAPSPLARTPHHLTRVPEALTCTQLPNQVKHVILPHRKHLHRFTKRCSGVTSK